MNLEKFTERSRGFIEAAQTIALRENHQRLVPEHLLKALLDDDQGLASNLISKAGGAPQRVAEQIDLSLGKLPKVSGDAGQVYPTRRRPAFWTRLRSLRRRPATASCRSNAS